jgi:hypothetical protein
VAAPQVEEEAATQYVEVVEEEKIDPHPVVLILESIPSLHPANQPRQ